MAIYLVIDPGSASKKYALYAGGIRALSAHFERENGKIVVTFSHGDSHDSRESTADEYDDATGAFVREAQTRGMVNDDAKIAGVGLRVVAPGSYFLENRIVDASFIQKLRAAEEFAPLHVRVAMAELQHLSETTDAPIVAVSDSVFHATMPDVARHYALPTDLADRYDIKRFGYHGISYASIVGKLNAMDASAKRVIACHLGGGASIAAILDGKSIDTTMGFTPLEGLAMATRSGDIDASAAIYLAKKMNLNLDQLEAFLNEKCGLSGVSGTSGDTREMLAEEEKGNARSTLALDLFAYRIRKYIGAYVAILGGVDTLVFSATIGERSSIMRSRICKGLEPLGIMIDHEKNDATIDHDGFIHADSSTVKIAVIATDEMQQIFHETVAMLEGGASVVSSVS